MKSVLLDIEDKLNKILQTADIQSNPIPNPFYGPKMYAAVNKGLSGKVLDEVVNWGRAVAETFKLSGDTLQHDIDLIVKDKDGMQSKITTKSALYESQMKLSKQTLANLKGSLEYEKERHDREISRKNDEIARNEKMYKDIMDMHLKSLEAMEERGKTLMKKLQEEKDILVNEETKLTGNTFALKNEAGSIQKSRREDASSLELQIKEQENKIASLESDCAKMDAEFERSMQTLSVQNNLASNKERAAQKRLLESEKMALDNDEREEEDTRAENLKALQTMITDKSVQLLNVKNDEYGSRFANPIFSPTSDDSSRTPTGASVPGFRGGSSQSSTASRPGSDQWGNTGKPKGKSNCKQS